MLSGFEIVMLLCAVGPAVLFCLNLRRYLPPPEDGGSGALPGISVLIPARDEEETIGPAIASVLQSTGVAFEVVVMDDGSKDRTAEVVQRMAGPDARVRLHWAPALPTGWNGKQHACWALAHSARYELMCFLDADVRVEPRALARMAAFLTSGGAGLVSGFPLEETKTWMEWLLLPLIHFVLLGFLPMARMRSTCDPALAAGCGQFLMVRREAYFECGGHAAIKATMHDGLLLPRLFRGRGVRTDLADLTGLATCRMYRTAGQVWQGLAKNATEGIGDRVRIVPVTLFLLMGQVLPFALAAWFGVRGGASSAAWLLISGGMAAAWMPRVLAARRFRQDWRSCLLHPMGIVVLLAIQWYALARRLTGGAVSWKDRAYMGE